MFLLTIHFLTAATNSLMKRGVQKIRFSWWHGKNISYIPKLIHLRFVPSSEGFFKKSVKHLVFHFKPFTKNQFSSILNLWHNTAVWPGWPHHYESVEALDHNVSKCNVSIKCVTDQSLCHRRPQWTEMFSHVQHLKDFVEISSERPAYEESVSRHIQCT